MNYIKEFSLIITNKEEYQIVLGKLHSTSKTLNLALRYMVIQNSISIDMAILNKLYFDFSILYRNEIVSAPLWNPHIAKHLLNKKSLINSLKYYTEHNMIDEFYVIYKSIEYKIKCRECFSNKIQCHVIPYEIRLLIVSDEQYDCPKCKKVMEIKHTKFFSL